VKLLTYKVNEQERLGIWTEKGIVDVIKAKNSLELARCPEDVMEVITRGDEGVGELRALLDRFKALASESDYLDESQLNWEPCVTRPNKIICIGLNYRKHAEETNAPIPESPVVFCKFNNALTGNQAPIVIPKATHKVDYEAELAIVIGKKAKDVPQEKALEYVLGYCCANDLSARDLQRRTSQWLLGKTCDGFSPLGPYLVTADEVGNPNDLEIRTFVNGEVRQHSNTADMIFPCDEIISYISMHMTLLPGDVILTGTPAGVVMGYPPEKQVFLKPGDSVTVEIEKLGSLTNRFVKDA